MAGEDQSGGSGESSQEDKKHQLLCCPQIEPAQSVREESFAGGGSLPAWPLPTVAAAWKPAAAGSVNDVARRLRIGEPSVLARIRDDRILFDLRSIQPAEYDEIVAAARSACP